MWTKGVPLIDNGRKVKSMDVQDEQIVSVYHNNTEIYNGSWQDMDEDMQQDCMDYGDMFLLAPIEIADVLVILFN